MIELKNISYRYPDRTEALTDVSLSVNAGEKLVLAGPNGAGKSTLFLILNGILKPQSGQYLFEGKTVTYTKKDLLQLRKAIGIVFQEPDHQIFSASVYEEVSFGPLNLGLPHEEVKIRVNETMAALDIEDLKDRPAHSLSYGQKKRVTIASILTMDPRVIIFDEPTSGLDPAHAAEIVDLLNKLHQQGKTIIVSTHDMNFAYRWASRIVIMNEGRITGNGTSYDIFNNTTLIQESRLDLPLIFRVYHALKASDIPSPATIAEFIEQINIQS